MHKNKTIDQRRTCSITSGKYLVNMVDGATSSSKVIHLEVGIFVIPTYYSSFMMLPELL